MMRKGTALVELRALSPYARPDIPAVDEAVLTQPKAQIYLQAGAFSNRLSAQLTKQKLKRMTKKTIRIVKRKRQKQTLYCVQIGPIIAVSDSDKLIDKLLAVGIRHPWTVIGKSG